MLGFQVTLTDADTNYNLLTLVRAIASTYVDKARKVQIQAVDDAGAQVFKVGGADLGANEQGYTLTSGDFGPPFEAGGACIVGLAGMNARCSIAGKKLNITVWR